MEPFFGKGLDVTTDNFFTLVHLAEERHKKKTTIVRILNRMRREVPLEFKASKQKLYSSKILKTNVNITLTVYQGKPSKNVLLLSTVHKNVTISEDRKRLSETMEYYNATKFGVDVLD